MTGDPRPPSMLQPVSFNDDSGQYEQVDHPRHYQHQSGVEAITICEWMTFNLGNAVKYIMRCGAKPGVDAITDLRKSVWYLQRELARLERQEALRERS